MHTPVTVPVKIKAMDCDNSSSTIFLEKEISSNENTKDHIELFKILYPIA